MKRWFVAAASLMSALVVVAVAVGATASDTRRITVEAGVVGVALLAGALAWRAALLTPALIGLAAASATMLVHHRAAVTAAIPSAALLLVTGELAGWSYDLRSIVPESARLTRGRAVTILGLAAMAVIVSASILAVSGLPAPGGVLPEVAGLGAAVAVVAFAAFRRWDSRPPE
jgi:hypothetical protein